MKDEKNLRQKKGIQYIDSSKAGVKFRTKSLEARNAEYLDVLKKYDLQPPCPSLARGRTCRSLCGVADLHLPLDFC